MIQFE